VDLTERKLSEEMVLDMAGRLIAAHEEERGRIARELHDDLSQRMALLQIGVEQLGEDMSALSLKNREQLRAIGKIASEISSDIHNLSHQLHPSKLDTLGLVAAVDGFCREMSKQHALQIDFTHRDDLGQVPEDVTLCLFRIVQEGLRNVVKHSGADQATIDLARRGDEVVLCISDFGQGFAVGSARGNGGIGLISMRERIRLVRGELLVESELSRGTRIRARVPVPKVAHAEAELDVGGGASLSARA
jgi:signal transduction histidine kinase